MSDSSIPHTHCQWSYANTRTRGQGLAADFFLQLLLVLLASSHVEILLNPFSVLALGVFPLGPVQRNSPNPRSLLPRPCASWGSSPGSALPTKAYLLLPSYTLQHSPPRTPKSQPISCAPWYAVPQSPLSTAALLHLDTASRNKEPDSARPLGST